MRIRLIAGVVICAAALSACGSSPAVIRPTRLLGAGEVASSRVLPLGKIGPKWLLVETKTAATAQKEATSQILIVDPEGGIYTVRTLKASEAIGLAAWDRGGRFALVAVENEHPQSISYSYMNLVTGQWATGIGTVDDTSDPSQATYVASWFPGGVERPYANDALNAPSGKDIVESASFTDAGLLYGNPSTNAFRSLVVLTNNSQCQPVRWWTRKVVLTSCGGFYKDAPVPSLYLVPTNGSAVTPLTRPTAVDVGESNAWKINGTLYAQSLGSCGGNFLSTVGPHGIPHRVALGVGAYSSATVAVVAGNNIGVVILHGGCSTYPQASFLWYNTTTHHSTVTVGPPLWKDGVNSLLAYGYRARR